MSSHLTVEEKERIHIALHNAGGNRKLAAMALGLTYVELKNKIYNSPQLRQRWAGTEAMAAVPDDASALQRQVPEAPPEPTEEELRLRQATAVAMDAAALGRDLERLRLPPQAQELAVELYAFNRKHFIKALNMSAGGASRQQIMLNYHLDKNWERLEETRALLRSTVTPDAEGRPVINGDLREILIAEEKGLLDAQGLLLGIQDRYYKTVLQAALTQAQVQGRVKNGNKSKPGYTPTKPAIDVTDISPGSESDASLKP